MMKTTNQCRHRQQMGRKIVFACGLHGCDDCDKSHLFICLYFSTVFNFGRSTKYPKSKSFVILAVLRRSVYKRVCGSYLRDITPRQHSYNLRRCWNGGEPFANRLRCRGMRRSC